MHVLQTSDRACVTVTDIHRHKPLDVASLFHCMGMAANRKKMIAIYHPLIWLPNSMAAVSAVRKAIW